MCGRFCSIFYLSMYFWIGCGDSSFNYEIGARVSENIDNLLMKIIQSATIAQYTLDAGLLNTSDFRSSNPFLPGRNLFLSIKVAIDQIDVLQIGFEDRVYYALVNNPEFPYGIEMDLCHRNKTEVTYVYDIKKNGLPSSLANCSANAKNCPWSFDCTNKPWYIQGKAAMKKIWTNTFMQENPICPTISLVTPLEDGDGKFLGNIAANMGLLQISDYLLKSYHGKDTDVFIVDRNNKLFLIASSFNALLITTNNQMLQATLSENSIISESTTILIANNWPTYLVTYKNHYLQSILYNSSVPGINWYVIVLIPMDITIDYLSSGSSIYTAAIILTSLSITIAIICILISIIYRNSKLFKLSKPIFTLIVISGSILANIYCFFLIGENTDTSCTLRPWLFNLAFTLAFSPLLIKSYMVHRIFNNDQNTRHTNIPIHLVVAYSLILVAFDAILLSLSIYATGSGSRAVTSTVLLETGAYGSVTQCSTLNNRIFFYIELIFKAVLVAAACILSYLIRHVNGAIAGSKTLIVVVYNVAVISLFVMIIASNIKDVGISIIVTICGIVFCTVLSSTMLVLPTLYQYYKLGDHEAADEVMLDVFAQAGRERDKLNKRRCNAVVLIDIPGGAVISKNTEGNNKKQIDPLHAQNILMSEPLKNIIPLLGKDKLLESLTSATQLIAISSKEKAFEDTISIKTHFKDTSQRAYHLQTFTTYEECEKKEPLI